MNFTIHMITFEGQMSGFLLVELLDNNNRVFCNSTLAILPFRGLLQWLSIVGWCGFVSK